MHEVMTMACLVMLPPPVPVAASTLRTARVLTVLLIPLCVLVAGVGLFAPGFYRDSPISFPFEHGNDLAALVVGIPLLIVSLVFAARGSVRGYLLWMGTVGWAAYLGAIDAFSLQFNALFLAYVAILGLAIYTLILGLAAVDARAIARSFGDDTPTGWVGSYLIVASVLTALLWLSDIVPSIVAGIPPTAIAGRGIPVEPSHVLDLGILLPASILAGILLLRRHPWGYLLGGICLGLLVPLLATINVAAFFQLAAGQPIAAGPVTAYAVILVVNVVFTWRYFRNIHDAIVVIAMDHGRPAAGARARA
jgi:hypothetical protein